AVCRRGQRGARGACRRKQGEVSAGGGGGRGQVCGAATWGRVLGQGQYGGGGGGVLAVPGGGVQADGVAEDGAGDGGVDGGRLC
ncbi:MAG: 30S ribosomal protein S3, partial [bacterium]